MIGLIYPEISYSQIRDSDRSQDDFTVQCYKVERRDAVEKIPGVTDIDVNVYPFMTPD